MVFRAIKFQALIFIACISNKDKPVAHSALPSGLSIIKGPTAKAAAPVQFRITSRMRAISEVLLVVLFPVP